MRLFLIQVRSFILIGLLILLFIAFITYLFHQRISNNIEIGLNPGTTQVIIGDSHTMCGIDDTLLSSSRNLSSGGESYFYSYIKLREILKANPKLKTIYLGYSYHNIASYQNKRFYSSEYIHNFFPRYYFLMESEDFIELFKSNPVGVLSAWGKTIAKCFHLIFNGANIDYLNLGSFKARKESYLKVSIDKISENSDRYKLNGVALKEVQYLNKISILCKQNSIQLIFINMPVHPELRKLQEPLKDEYSWVYLTYFKDIKLLSFYEKFNTDSVFSDVDHLNISGSKLLTNSLVELE